MNHTKRTLPSHSPRALGHNFFSGNYIRPGSNTYSSHYGRFSDSSHVSLAPVVGSVVFGDSLWKSEHAPVLYLGRDDTWEDYYAPHPAARRLAVARGAPEARGPAVGPPAAPRGCYGRGSTVGRTIEIGRGVASERLQRCPLCVASPLSVV